MHKLIGIYSSFHRYIKTINRTFGIVSMYEFRSRKSNVILYFGLNKYSYVIVNWVNCITMITIHLIDYGVDVTIF